MRQGLCPFSIFREWKLVWSRRGADEKTVVDALLETLWLVAAGDQRTGLSSSVGFAFFNASVLIVFDSVRLDFVDDDTPFAFGIDGTQRLDLGNGAGAEISFVNQFSQSVDRVGRFSHDVLVQSHNGLVVFVKFVNDFVSWIFRILQAPVLGRVLGSSRDFWLVFWLVRRWRLVIIAHHCHHT